MKQSFLWPVLAAGVMATSVGFAADQPPASPTPAAQASVSLNSEEAKLSYVMGLNMGSNAHSHQVKLDTTVFMRGLNDGITAAPPLMTPAQIQETLAKFQKDMMTKQEEGRKMNAEKNLKEGEAYMQANKDKAGVKITDNGIQYRIISAGKGPLPKATDVVRVSYEGKLVNGTIFDSTAKSKTKYADLPLKQVIPGMQQIVTIMPVGSTWEIVIPPKLAYGEKGVGFGPIGPNETLIFTLTLQGISKGS